MARLLRTATLGTTVSRQDLYDLIHTASLTDIGVVPTNVGSVVASTNSPTCFTSTTWWFDQEAQLLRVPINNVSGSACSLWMSIGPDSWEVPIYNGTADAIPRGRIVSWSVRANAGLYDVDQTFPMMITTTSLGHRPDAVRLNVNARNVIGVTTAAVAASSWALAVYRGFCYTDITDYNTTGTFNSVDFIVLSTAVTGVGSIGGGNLDGWRFPHCIGLTVLRHATSSVGHRTLTPAFLYLPMGMCTYI